MATPVHLGRTSMDIEEVETITFYSLTPTLTFQWNQLVHSSKLVPSTFTYPPVKWR